LRICVNRLGNFGRSVIIVRVTDHRPTNQWTPPFFLLTGRVCHSRERSRRF
jgi:hypothetical protein